MTKQLSPEQLAHSSYSMYSAYVTKSLDRKLTEKEYSKLMDDYINSVPVTNAVKKLEKAK